MKIKVILIVCLCFGFLACDEEKDHNPEADSENYRVGNSNYSSEEGEDENQEKDYSEDEKLSNGNHSATVDYYNPETGYSQTYTLDVEVEDGEVTKIYFPNGGYLDNDHITPTELDEEGNGQINGEDGKTYDIQIEE